MKMKKENQPQVCDTHPHIEAVYQCEQCLRKCCDQCVNPEAHLFFCSYCGANARRIVVIKDEPIRIKETAAAASGLLKSLALRITNHIIVPASIILMVAAFLFYLLDVRSVYLTATDSLKQIGFFFAAATVLIARYGKGETIGERQTLYTGILAVATFFTMMKFSGKGIGIIVNLAVIFVVWKFATAVTDKLDLVEEEKEPEPQSFFGVERVHHQELERKFNLRRPNRFDREGKKEKSEKKVPGGHDAHGNPSASVARLAVMAVIAFALGEPVLLAGPPEVGQRALAAVIVFLLSTGIVLAASSAAGTFRHTIQSGGKASLGMVPVKICIAIVLLAALLAVGLSVPGIKYQGSGRLKPPPELGGSGSIHGSEKNPNMSDSSGKQQQSDTQQQQQSGKGGEGKSKGSGDQAPGKSPFQWLFNFFGSLGKLLMIPLVLFFIGFVIYALFKLWPALKGWRLGMKNRFGKWLEKLR
ncbi:MAG: hypothetical protein GY940_08145, partial [bacterium]|nr:hypothetical protein [bacterium]